MTLRLRLVVALALLVTAGLAVFGLATYTLYARSLYDQLDDQIRAAAPLVTEELRAEAGLGPGGFPSFGGPGGPGGDDDGPPLRIAPDTYGELRAADGTVLSELALGTTTSVPDLPEATTATAGYPRTYSVGSTSGSGRWRVLEQRVVLPRDPGSVVFVAVPETEIRQSLDRLVVVEALTATGLLLVLALGSWVILRRGLRPLETMAESAGSITAGNLSLRVETPDARTEVGQLGVAINTMLDEIEAAFREREASEARLRQFLADASHELRTPLTSIQGFAELFRLEDRDAELDLPVILRRIEEESARMKTLVEDLLLLARLDETRPVRREPVDLTVLAADACTDAAATAPDRRFTLDGPEPVVVLGDPDHLRQAIGNLVSNALRHTPAGSPVEVHTALEDGRAVVAVRDHGPGIDAATVAHAFDRFWQADDARVGPGAGLGLSIVEGIAHEHGGIAEAANADGGGAVFRLRLPIGPPATS
jgi:two-component system OmpR family sensor kinase